MKTETKQSRLVTTIAVLCFIITVLSCISGVSAYRSNICRIYQNLVHVELTDFIENTRYALHFGKDIGSFYRMNEILSEEIRVIDDVDGLYVVSDAREVLFATDGRELSRRVLGLLDANRIEGDQFYVGLPLTQDGSARLIARCSSKAILLQQSSFLFRFLIVCIVGGILAQLLIILLWRSLGSRRYIKTLLMLVLSVWILVLSTVGGATVYRDYSRSIGGMRTRIEEAANRDINKVKAAGVKDSSISSLDTYFARYENEISEVEQVTLIPEKGVQVTLKPYGQRITLTFIVQAVLFLVLSTLALLAVHKLTGRRTVPEQSAAHTPAGRTSIKTKLQRMVLIISATALIITSVISVFIMMMIRSQSESALITETQSNLTSLVRDKAALAEAQLEQYRDFAEFYSQSLSSIYARPEEYTVRQMQTPVAGDPDEYICTTIRRLPELDISEFSEELGRTYNLMDVLSPIRDPSNNIAEFYWGDEHGFMTLYEPRAESQDPSEIYDFWNSSWYSACRKEREIIFTDIYNDAFGNGLTITCAAPYYDGNGDFIGVFGLDVLISDIYDEIVQLDLGDGAYAFLVDPSGNIISTDGTSTPLSVGEDLDEDACERLLTSDGAVFERNGIYYTGARVPLAGWTLCIHAPADLTLSTVRTIDNEIIVSIIVFVIVFAVILLAVAAIINGFAASIADPIIALKEDVARISGGNLDYRAEIRTDDEIGELAASFNDMSSSLKEYVENVRSMTAEKERLGAELSVATRIQADMLPSHFPAFPERTDFDIYASMTPAKEVGGDFYDFFLIDDDHLGLVIADVSGKGVPAAMFMVITRTLIKNHALSGEGPAQILTSVNRQLCENNDEMLFVTAWIGILTLSTGALATADAGHEYPAIRRGVSGSFELVITEHYPPLGTIPDNEYVQEDLTLSRGDALFLYTDGVTDARNSARSKFGADRMLASINRHADRSPEELLVAIKSDIDSFIGGNDQFDDITMMSVTYK